MIIEVFIRGLIGFEVRVGKRGENGWGEVRWNGNHLVWFSWRGDEVLGLGIQYVPFERGGVDKRLFYPHIYFLFAF